MVERVQEAQSVKFAGDQAMMLTELKYAEFEGQPREWRLDGLDLGQTNLLVGRNATGKTRVLNAINSLAGLLSGPGSLRFVSGHYEALFDREGDRLNYVLKYEDSQVREERFSINGKALLIRGEGGSGTIFAEKMNDMLQFQTPVEQLAVVARRDELQHSFFTPLNEWGASVRHFPFGTGLGKDNYALFVPEGPKPDLRDPSQVVAVYKKALADHGEIFEETVRTCMAELDYKLDEIGIARPKSVMFKLPVPGEIVGMFVREHDLRDITDQHDMSQGMFRALSLVIQVAYSNLSGKPSCILIDDIGEGLDFERSKALIDLLMRQTKASSVQLVMATNDRFVMNKVPIETWSVLLRTGGACKVLNYKNSRRIFDEFKFTGMSNFDFFAFDFPSRGCGPHE